jgi:hypothetical protein
MALLLLDNSRGCVEIAIEVDMKRIVFVILLLWLINSAMFAVNGTLTDLGDRYLLHVWGNHYERGHALGYLMGDQIMTVFKDYFFVSVVGNNPIVYNNYLQYYQDHYVTDARYQQEIQGIVAGMQEAGTDMYHQRLNRDLYADDLLFVNAVVDLSVGSINMACSSLSSWGQATLNDPELTGKLQITRLLDWTRSQALINNSLLVVQHPSEADEMKWISFTYPGLIGALSAISEEKAAAFLNVGNSHPNNDTEDLSTVLLNVRTGLERRDFNGDGVYSNEDLFDALVAGKHLSGSIIHNVQEWADSSRAVVIETNNSGTVRRMHGENSGIAGDNLAATNHFRKLTNATYCSRYNKIIDSLAVSSEVDIQRQWHLMQGAGGVTTNLMMIQYLPSQNSVLWANATPYYPAYTQEPQYFDLDQLFTQPTHNLDATQVPRPALRLYPNPLSANSGLKELSGRKLTRVKIFNIKGQLVYDATALPRAEDLGSSGLYVLVCEDTDGHKYCNRVILQK